MSNTESWILGVFEGEGSIIIDKRYSCAYIKVKSTDFDVLKRIQEYLGGRLYKQPEYPNRKQAYDWVLQNKKLIREILERWLPYLSLRRACKAQDALDRIDKCYENYGVVG